MSDVSKRIADFSPEKRKLFELLLKQRHEPPLKDAIERRNGSGAKPLSFAQQSLWLLDQIKPGSSLYNIAGAFRLRGNLDRLALEQSINEIARRHESLRTCIQVKDGQPVQIISPAAYHPLPLTDLGEFAPEARELNLRQFLYEAAHRPFNLAQGPLYRVSLFRLAADEHVLLLMMHHIIADGWSIGLFIRELAILYRAFFERQPSPLPELPIQYADYAIFQRERLQGEALQSGLDYWKRQLGDNLPVLELPTDRPRPSAQTFEGTTRTFSLPKALSGALKELSQQQQTTLFMTLLAAFQTLLHRYSAQEEIVVGTDIANRNRAEVEKLIGFFINQLVLRTSLSDDPSFNELLGRVREMTLEAYAHQEVPFELLVEHLQPVRDNSRSPLFQVKFVFQNTPSSVLELPELTITRDKIESTTAKFDLLLTMMEGADGLNGFLEYNTGLFNASTVERMLNHFRVLLEGIVENPERRLSQLPLLDEDERNRLLFEWNNSRREFPRHEHLHQLFEQQVARTPDAPAVIFNDQHLTYAQLNARANQLAHHLRELGVGAEVVVGICVERSLEMVVGLLGILKAGSAYLPLDANYPQERLAYMLEDAQVQVLLTQQHLTGYLPAHWGYTICLDADWENIRQQSSDDPNLDLNPDNLAYVIYTSGSTGTPKGVMITHRSICNHMRWMQSDLPLSEADSVLQKTPFSFDASVWEFYAPLLAGAQLVIAQPTRHPDTSLIIEAINEYEITILQLVPSLFRMLLADEKFASCHSLRHIFCGGEALPSALPRECRQNPAPKIFNLYGPTETTIEAAYSQYDSNHSGTTVPIGRPISNTQMYILDRNLQPVPVGIPGELHIGGIALARGYLHRSDLTAEKFIPHPFSRSGGERLYRTGDVARYLEDGNIEYVGRADTQVKVRGYRIELGEIEAVVGEHPLVRQCVVTVREEAAGDQRIVAYVVWAEQGSDSTAGVEIEKLKEYVRERVPAYMMPQSWVVMNQLPLSANGKVDRRALPAPSAQEATDTEAATELTPIEEMMEGIWLEVLQVERVGVEENFFERGGHSLLATQVVSRIREVFGVEVALRSLFEEGTLGALSRRVEATLREEASTLAPPLVPVSRDRELLLSFAQQRLWFLHQLEPDNGFYNMFKALRLAGELHLPALEQTLSEVVRRHEALRTCFLTVGGQPQQVISPPQPIELPVTDLSHLFVEEREATVRELVRDEAARPFNLSTGPVLRVRLLRLDEEEHILLCGMHHIVSDGWSMGVLIREVAALYEAFSRELPSPLPELAVQYADYAVWQREWLQGDVLEQQLAYWREQLGGELPVLELPTDRVRPAVKSHRGAHYPFRLSTELTQHLKQLSQREGATLFMTLLAAFQTLLSRYSGQQDIIVGSPIAGRNRQETEHLIGFFVNTLALRTDLGGQPSFRELLSRLREVCLSAYAHQDVPFEKLVEELQPERDLSRSPLFQVMFGLQNAPGEQLRMSGVQVSSVGTEVTTAKFDLTLLMHEQDEELRAAIEYSTDLFEAGTIERLARHWTVLLEAIVKQPERSIDELALLEEAERAQIIYEWNETAQEYPTESCIHELFEQQVERTPDAVALVCAGQEVSYAELNARANQLAHYLREQGVGAEVRVGLCLERSIDMVVALLGILKAGGAYVPLDPQYPAQRLAFMLRDAGVEVLITQEQVRHHLLESVPLPTEQPQATQPQFVLCIDSAGEIISAQSTANPQRTTISPTPDNLAYVIYTSGSTGTPKGVAITHASLLNYLSWASRYYPFTDAASVPLHSSLSFDLTVTSLFCPLLVGRFVHLLAPATEAETLSQLWTQGGGYSVVKVTPAHLAVINPEATPERMRQWTKALVVGGEALRWEQVREWVRAGVRVYNEYGPTETVVGSCVYEVRGAQGEEERGHGGVLIGRPVSNTQVYILDERMEVVGVGIRGELYIGGAGVARGYLHRPELTAEKFVPHPYSRQEGGRLYRTGDVARYLEDGSIEYVGRADTQVKVRGYRIELGEIEAVVSEHPLVQQCVVIVREEVAGDQRIVAYVVWAEQGSDDTAGVEIEELKRYVRERVPMYMVPQGWVVLEQLPLSANGKVDRRALPIPAVQDVVETEAGLTPIEEMMEGIWREVLQVERVGVGENFFERGGHSLLATQVISRVRETFHVDLPLRSVFEEGTLGALSRRVEAALRDKESTVAPPLVAVSRDRELPLSFAQQRLWFLQQLEPGSGFYNMPVALRLRGSLNIVVLEQTLNEVVQRHEALRTCFLSVGGQPQQVISPPQPIELPIADLSRLAVTERETTARKLARESAAHPFDLVAGPLLRVQLLRLGAEENILLFTVHHIASDGWSMGVLIREVAALYEAFSRELPSPLPELAVQYADYAVWQREWLQGDALEQQLAYWREQLGGELPVLELPADRAHPVVQSYRGGHHIEMVSVSVLAGLKELSRRAGATLFMTLLAAFQTLLHRYSGQDDIVVGTAIANRNRAETEPLIGLFVNTLVLRTKMKDELTFGELLASVRGVCLGAYMHQDVPFEKLVEELQPERDLSRSPLFQTMFILQNAAPRPLEVPGLTVDRLRDEGQTAKLDMILSATEAKDGLELDMEFSTDLFDRARIERMLRHLKVLLESVVECPDMRIDELPLLAEQESAQILYEWNKTEREYPTERCIHELFEQQVERAPDAPAVVCAGQELNYRELDEQANQLAHYLQKQGVGEESLVGLCIERSVGMVVALLAILKTGAAYLPLDPAYPTERLNFMLRDAGCELLLTRRHLVGAIQCENTRAIMLDADTELFSSESKERPTRHSSAGSLAYVIYTSGSTGTPKGVMVSHRSVINLFQAINPDLEISKGEVWTNFHSFAFDFSVWEIWGALLSGSQLVIVPLEMAHAPSEFHKMIVARGVTVLSLTPSVMGQLVREVSDSDWASSQKSFERIIIGGEAFPRELAEIVCARGKRVWNFYGPTEATVWASLEEVKPDNGEITIGRPIGNTQIYILDRNLQPVPVGIPGELHIGGTALARGYLHQSALTAEKFIPHPFSRSGGERLYRTGDLARYLEDGSIEYVGRADTQVKVRGYRIELGEIEAVVSERPLVQQCVVTVRQESEGDKRLVCYLVWAAPHSEAEVRAEIEEIKRHVRERVPAYMVPQNWVVLDQLPLSANGKVDRRALPAPNTASHATETERELTPVEEMMEGIWREVLHVERVGVGENFFERGGHSLLATQVISRVRETFQIDLPLRSLFEEGTLGRLSRRVEAALRDKESTIAPPLMPVSRDRELPLSFAQQRLWFLNQLEPHSTSYNMPAAVRLSGRLHVAALEQTLSEVVRRHEALRTRFSTVRGQPQQVISPPQAVALPLIDLSRLPVAEREASARELARKAAEQPFDLANGPLLRMNLLRMDEAEHVLLLTMHHIVSDGWSLGVLVREVVTLYRAFYNGLPSPLRDLPVQYADYAMWQREWLRGEVLERQMAFWKRELEGARFAVNLPLDRPRPVHQTFRGARQYRLIPQSTSEKIREVSQREGVTAFMILLAAFQTLLYRYAGQEEIVVGTPIANRNHIETEKMIGFFANMLPLRMDMSGNPSFRELLAREREVTLRAYAHQDLPFEKLVEELQPDRATGQTSLFQVLFALQNMPKEILDLPGLEVRYNEVEAGTTKFDLAVNLSDTGQEIRCSFDYNTDIFDDSTMTRMLRHYENLLRSAVESPHISIDSLEMLSAEESFLLEKRVSIDELEEGFSFDEIQA